jgi:hypothetical protein
MSLVLLALLALVLSACATTPVGGAPAEGADPPAAEVSVDPADVASVDAILAAVYDTISGPAGEPRDWARFRGLMHPDGARLMATVAREDGTFELAVFTPETYIDRVDEPFTSRGFFERELHREEQRFGHVAHAFSTYAISSEADGEVLRRGMNSYQLWYDGRRWYVVSILWDDERPDQPLPPSALGER